MKTLRKKQVDRILQLVDKNFLSFVGKSLGSSLFSSDDKRKLKEMGINSDSYEKEGNIDTMFKLGVLSKSLSEEQMSKMTLRELRIFLAKNEHVKLNNFEKEIVDRAKNKVYDELFKISLDFKKVLKDFYRGDFRKEMFENKDDVKNILLKYTLSAKDKKALKEKVKQEIPQWTRRVDLIIDTMMHEVFTLGRVMYIAKSGKEGLDQRVYVRVFEGACGSCYKIYTEGGKDTPSKIFKLSELLANGNNHNVKRKDWIPVLPPTHPYCRCLIEKYVEGGTWDSSLNNYVIEIK